MVVQAHSNLSLNATLLRSLHLSVDRGEDTYDVINRGLSRYFTPEEGRPVIRLTSRLLIRQWKIWAERISARIEEMRANMTGPNPSVFEEDLEEFVAASAQRLSYFAWLIEVRVYEELVRDLYGQYFLVARWRTASTRPNIVLRGQEDSIVAPLRVRVGSLLRHHTRAVDVPSVGLGHVPWDHWTVWTLRGFGEPRHPHSEDCQGFRVR